MPVTPRPVRATERDRESIAALLRASDLPAESLDDLEHFFVIRSKASGELAGCVGLEFHGSTAILRSLAVSPEERGRGLSRLLTDVALERARERGASEVVVLTYTAVDLFSRIGFREVVRSEVDEAALKSWQFQSGVCDKATCLRLALDTRV
jgi:amino-acid N-acetyltransferase